VERFEVCRDILRSEFMPPSPAIEDTVMAMIAADDEDIPEMQCAPVFNNAAFPGGFSTRSWIITGIGMLVSLVTVFFGMEFNNVVVATGVSFLLPLGITIGIALTSYGAIFIGSHLKELSEYFGIAD
jgi:hypothetical protein